MQSRKASLWLTLVSAALLCLGSASPSTAGSENLQNSNTARNRAQASRQSDEVVLVLTGVIQPGAYRQFRAAIARKKPAVIVLNSPGGVLQEALLIGDEVRRRGINTLIAPRGTCASACAVVFLSGRTKFMGKGAEVGLHSASRLDGRADAAATNIMAAYLRGVGVPGSILRRMAQTKPSEIRWLTRAEQKALRIRPMS